MSKVRLATGEDIPDIVELNRQVQNLHASLYPEDFTPQADHAELLALLARIIADPAHALAVYGDAGNAQGYVWLELQQRPETALTRASKRVHVHHLAVADASRRRGIGSALMRWVEDHAASKGVRQIVVEHWAANETAQAFFARSGFSAVRTVLRKGLADAG